MVRLLHYQYNTKVSPIWDDFFINNLILKSFHIGTTLLKMLIKVVWIWHDFFITQNSLHVATTSAYFNQIRLNLARLLQDEVVPFFHDLPLPGIKKKTAPFWEIGKKIAPVWEKNCPGIADEITPTKPKP